MHENSLYTIFIILKTYKICHTKVVKISNLNTNKMNLSPQTLLTFSIVKFSLPFRMPGEAS